MKSRAFPNLAAVIAARGLTHSEVADAVGVGPTSVNHILCGRRRPSADLRARFAVALGVEEDVLFEMNPDVARIIEAANAQGLGHLVAVAPGVKP
jgi:transcriptional regulator with XRE-family HTH domain